MDNYSKKQQKRTLTQDGLEVLMDDYSNSLFSFVRGTVKNNEIAEELVSDVFVKLWKKKDLFPSIKNIQSYLFILARNEAISYIRKKEDLKIIRLEEIQEYYSIPLENNDQEEFNREIVEKINNSIDSLPAKCKMAFSLAKINGLKYKEIAEIMEISTSTVKHHISTALEKICEDVGILKNGKGLNQSDIYLLILYNKNKNIKKTNPHNLLKL